MEHHAVTDDVILVLVALCCILPDQQLDLLLNPVHKVNWCWADLTAGSSSSFTLMVMGVACEQGLGCTEVLAWIEVHST